MSFQHPPKEVSSTYNPQNFNQPGVEEGSDIDLSGYARKASSNTFSQPQIFTSTVAVSGQVTASNVTATNAVDVADAKSKLVLNTENIANLSRSPNVPSGIWGNDLVCYYDFTDENNLPFDCGPYALHGENFGCVVSNSGQNTATGHPSASRLNSVWLSVQPFLNGAIAHTNHTMLDLSPAASRLNLSSYTISCWARRVGPTGTTQTFVSCGKKQAVSSPANAPCIALLCSDGPFLIRATNADGSVQFRVDTQTNISSGTWVHMAVVITPSSNAVYFNGVLRTVYHTGNNTLSFDLSSPSLVPDHLLCGGTWENHLTTPTAPKYKWGANCNLSDLSIWNRALSTLEVQALYNDNYGYSVIGMAGQSNMVGFNTLRAGIDDNYSKITGKVFQYETETNINATTHALLQDPPVISAPSHPLKWPIAEVGSAAGMWHGLCDKMCTEMRLPFRRKILLLPMAKGATGFANGDWRVGDPRYLGAIAALTHVLEYSAQTPLNKLNHLTAFLWSQGERDMANLNLTYKTDWYNMYNGFKAAVPRFGLPATILCHVGGDYDSYLVGSVSMKALINSQLAEIVSENSSYMRLNVTGKKAYFEGTNHYGAAGIRQQGEDVLRNLADIWDYPLSAGSEAIEFNRLTNSSAGSTAVNVNRPANLNSSLTVSGASVVSDLTTGNLFQKTHFINTGGETLLNDLDLPSAVHVRTTAATVTLHLKDDASTLGRRVRIFVTSAVSVTIKSKWANAYWGLVVPDGSVATEYVFTGPGYVDCIDIPSVQISVSQAPRRWCVLQPILLSQTTAINALENSVALKANSANPTFSGVVSGVTKTHVGLPNVDDTSDLAKPISTEMQTALDLKANSSDMTTALNLKANQTAVDALNTYTGKTYAPDNYQHYSISVTLLQQSLSKVITMDSGQADRSIQLPKYANNSADGTTILIKNTVDSGAGNPITITCLPSPSFRENSTAASVDVTIPAWESRRFVYRTISGVGYWFVI